MPWSLYGFRKPQVAASLRACPPVNTHTLQDVHFRQVDNICSPSFDLTVRPFTALWLPGLTLVVLGAFSILQWLEASAIVPQIQPLIRLRPPFKCFSSAYLLDWEEPRDTWKTVGRGRSTSTLLGKNLLFFQIFWHHQQESMLTLSGSCGSALGTLNYSTNEA